MNNRNLNGCLKHCRITSSPPFIPCQWFPPCHPQSMVVGHGRPPPRPAARVRPARKISILNPEVNRGSLHSPPIVLTSTNGIQQNGRWIRGVPVWMWGATLPWVKSWSTHDVISRSLENRFWTDFQTAKSRKSGFSYSHDFAKCPEPHAFLFSGNKIWWIFLENRWFSCFSHPSLADLVLGIP